MVPLGTNYSFRVNSILNDIFRETMFSIKRLIKQLSRGNVRTIIARSRSKSVIKKLYFWSDENKIHTGSSRFVRDEITLISLCNVCNIYYRMT